MIDTYIVAETQSSTEGIVSATCPLNVPITIYDRGHVVLEIGVVFVAVQPHWLSLGELWLTVGDLRDPDVEWHIVFDNVDDPFNRPAVLMGFQKQLAELFGTRDAHLKLVAESSKKPARLILRKQATVQFSEPLRKLLGLPSELANQDASRQMEHEIEYVLPERNPMDKIYWLKSDQIRQTFIRSGHADRVLDFFSIRSAAHNQLAEYTSFSPRYCEIDGLHLTNIKFTLYNFENQPVTSKIVNFLVIAHLRSRPAHP